MSQDDLIARRGHCSVDGRLLVSVAAAVGQQVRIRRTEAEYALYTVSERRDEVAADLVRLGLMGRRRLGTDDPFAAVGHLRRWCHRSLERGVGSSRS